MQNQNQFEADKSYFFFDSDHLDRVQSIMYGFAVTDDGIIENCNLKAGDLQHFTGNGVYVVITRDGDNISIKQDFDGSYGIYYYQSDDYFAFSNSFAYLVEKIDNKYKLTINKDYSYHMLATGLVSTAFSETACNEIVLLDRWETVSIDIPTKKILFKKIDYQSNSISPASAEGMKILDQWFKRWTTLIRNIRNNTENIIVDLSGGFDSRLTFMLAIASGIDMQSITVTSADNQLYTHSEDYVIATKIANHFGFKLNRKENLSEKGCCFTKEDILNMSIYGSIFFHKQMYCGMKKWGEKRYCFPGYGGESVRNHWNITPDELMCQYVDLGKRYIAEENQEQIQKSMEIIQNSAFRRIMEKYHIQDKQSKYITLNMYRDIRCRGHFGRPSAD